MKNKMAPPI